MNNPRGPIQWRWYSFGYQDAMEELGEKLDRGGMDEVREWIENNRPRRARPESR